MMLFISFIIGGMVCYAWGYINSKEINFDRGYNACFKQLLTGNVKPEDSIKKCRQKLEECFTLNE